MYGTIIDGKIYHFKLKDDKWVLVGLNKFLNRNKNIELKEDPDNWYQLSNGQWSNLFPVYIGTKKRKIINIQMPTNYRDILSKLQEIASALKST